MAHVADATITSERVWTVCLLSEKEKRELGERLFREAERRRDTDSSQEKWVAVYTAKQIENRAKRGDPGALKKQGDMYLAGDYYAQDIAKAADHYKQAVRRGSLEAGVCLGRLYQTGTLGYLDDKEAVRLFRQAALLKCVPAYIALGDSYAMGWGVQKERGAATSWYAKAEEVGSSEASQRLEELENLYAGRWAANPVSERGSLQWLKREREKNEKTFAGEVRGNDVTGHDKGIIHRLTSGFGGLFPKG